MRIHQNQFLAAFGMFLAAWATQAQAQINLPFGPEPYSHDFQLFAPAQIDLDNEVYQDNYGYWAGYEKLAWSYTGEKVTIGSPDATAFAEIIYYENHDLPAQDIGSPPSTYQIQNTIKNAGPKAGFDLGDRYEFGYRNRGNGWTIGILDGPEVTQTQFYGFVPNAALGGGLPPFIDDDYTDGSDIGPGTGPVGDARAFGFGSVPVLFDAPEGYFQGFRDYLMNISGAQQGTVGGPYLNVGNYGIAVFEEPNEIDDDVLFRRADDLNENGIWGFGIVVDEDDNIIAIITDFEDLHTFDVYFDNLTVRNRTETDGVEAMWSHELTNRHYMAKHQNNSVTLSAGARFFRLKDQFDVLANGSFLGQSFWNTTFNNQIVGPQVGVNWTNRRRRWMIQADGRFLFGFNIADWNQDGLMGSNLVPGALNKPLYARATAFSHGLTEHDFSPVAEMRLKASYFVTKALALNVGYTGMYVGQIHRAATSVHYNLPDMGYSKAGTQNMLVNGVDFGVEFVY